VGAAQILDKLVAAKRARRLGKLPTVENLFLKNLIALAKIFPDLVAIFLEVGLHGRALRSGCFALYLCAC
jgi:hypothetical protein